MSYQARDGRNTIGLVWHEDIGPATPRTCEVGSLLTGLASTGMPLSCPLNLSVGSKTSPPGRIAQRGFPAAAAVPSPGRSIGV